MKGRLERAKEEFQRKEAMFTEYMIFGDAEMRDYR